MYWNLVSLRIVQWIHISSLAYSEPTVPIVRPVCTKSKCNAGADRGTGSDTKDENLNFLVVGELLEVYSSWQQWDHIVQIVAVITITSSDIDRENCHYETHCAPENTRGGVIERGSLLSIEFWCRNSVHINNLVFSRRSDHCPMITRRVMLGESV